MYSKNRITSSTLDKSNYVGVDNLLHDKAGKVDSNHVPSEGNSTGFFTNDILIGNIRPYLKKYGMQIVKVEQMVMFL